MTKDMVILAVRIGTGSVFFGFGLKLVCIDNPTWTRAETLSWTSSQLSTVYQFVGKKEKHM